MGTNCKKYFVGTLFLFVPIGLFGCKSGLSAKTNKDGSERSSIPAATDESASNSETQQTAASNPVTPSAPHVKPGAGNEVSWQPSEIPGMTLAMPAGHAVEGYLVAEINESEKTLELTCEPSCKNAWGVDGTGEPILANLVLPTLLTPASDISDDRIEIWYTPVQTALTGGQKIAFSRTSRQITISLEGPGILRVVILPVAWHGSAAVSYVGPTELSLKIDQSTPESARTITAVLSSPDNQPVRASVTPGAGWTKITSLNPGTTYTITFDGLMSHDIMTPSSLTARTFAKEEPYATTTLFNVCYNHSRHMAVNPVTGRTVISGQGGRSTTNTADGPSRFCYGEYDGVAWRHLDFGIDSGAIGYWIFSSLDFDATGRVWMTGNIHTGDAAARIQVWSCPASADCLQLSSWSKSLDFLDAPGGGAAGTALQIDAARSRAYLTYQVSASGLLTIRECGPDLNACATSAASWSSPLTIPGASGWEPGLHVISGGQVVLMDNSGAANDQNYVHVCREPPCTTTDRWTHGRFRYLTKHNASNFGLRLTKSGTVFHVAKWSRERGNSSYNLEATYALRIASCDSAVVADCFATDGSGFFTGFTGDNPGVNFGFVSAGLHDFGPPPYLRSTGWFYTYQFRNRAPYGVGGDDKAYWSRCNGGPTGCGSQPAWSTPSLMRGSDHIWNMYGAKEVFVASDGNIAIPLGAANTNNNLPADTPPKLVFPELP